MLVRLAIVSLDGGAAGVRRLLGKNAVPKRKYRLRAASKALRAKQELEQ